MSSLLSTFSCCWFWLLLGILLGWLLNRWLCKCCCKTDQSNPNNTSNTPETSTTKLVETPSPDPRTEATSQPMSIDLAAAKAAGFTIKNANDLTVIEGIGPKINELFKDNDVKTFADLAKLTIPQMRIILDKGGSRFRIANPETWAQQSALAAENKWTELKKLQGNLSGGVKK
jgi:predicted flap endonuclease-1-like 5' DNA nuclease